MKKLESNFKNMVLVLSGITIFAAIALASVYDLTKVPIEQKKYSRQLDYIRAVLPPYDHFDTIPIKLNNGVETTKVYKAFDKNNKIVGAAVESSSNNGYRGHINIIVGFNRKGVIINYTVLEGNETLGLGSKMVDWFKTKSGNQNIIGKNAGTAHLNVKVDGGEVDAITAATISSRAFLFAVRNAYFEFKTNIIDPVNVTDNVVDSLHHAKSDTISDINSLKMKGDNQ
jgi:electron transport complex protein RnfG